MAIGECGQGRNQGVVRPPLGPKNTRFQSFFR